VGKVKAPPGSPRRRNKRLRHPLASEPRACGSGFIERRQRMAKEPKKLDELFHDTLKDIYFAEKKILSTLPNWRKLPKMKS
jgi:hypothetical protein